MMEIACRKEHALTGLELIARDIVEERLAELKQKAVNRITPESNTLEIATGAKAEDVMFAPELIAEILRLQTEVLRLNDELTCHSEALLARDEPQQIVSGNPDDFILLPRELDDEWLERTFPAPHRAHLYQGAMRVHQRAQDHRRREYAKLIEKAPQSVVQTRLPGVKSDLLAPIAVTVQLKVKKLDFDVTLPVPEAICELGRYSVDVNYGIVELNVPSGTFISTRLKRISVGLGATIAELIDIAQADYEKTILGALGDTELMLDPRYQIVPVRPTESMIDASLLAADEGSAGNTRIALPVITRKEEQA